MIVDIHVHHVPEAFVRFVEKVAPFAVLLEPPRGEDVKLNVGPLSYALTRTFFDPERLVANLHRAYAEERGAPLGERIPSAPVFAEMVRCNGGRPLTCLA